MIICPFLLVCGAKAQTMQVWLKDGTRQDYAVSSIESITFSEQTDMDLARQEIERFLDDGWGQGFYGNVITETDIHWNYIGDRHRVVSYFKSEKDLFLCI